MPHRTPIDRTSPYLLYPSRIFPDFSEFITLAINITFVQSNSHSHFPRDVAYFSEDYFFYFSSLCQQYDLEGTMKVL